jgi:hypothetical protein
MRFVCGFLAWLLCVTPVAAMPIPFTSPQWSVQTASLFVAPILVPGENSGRYRIDFVGIDQSAPSLVRHRILDLFMDTCQLQFNYATSDELSRYARAMYITVCVQDLIDQENKKSTILSGTRAVLRFGF